MQIGLTIPLMRFIKIKSLPYGEPCIRKYCWDLHRIMLRGCGCLLAVHCETRYTFTMYNLTAADWNDLAGVFCCGIATNLTGAGFEESVIRRYLSDMGEIEFTKTHGRREVAFLNRAWEDVMKMDSVIDQSEQRQPLLDHAVNRIPCRCAGFEGLGTPFGRMQESLGR